MDRLSSGGEMSHADRMIKPLRFVLWTATLVAMCSCSSFDSAWREAVASPAPGNTLSGPWEGRWVSEASGHEGRLRCLIAPDLEQASNYHFRYWAQWGLFSGQFETSYPVEEVAPGRWRFSGDSDLGRLAGVYRHDGEATASDWRASYTSSKGDRGTMVMRRPAMEID